MNKTTTTITTTTTTTTTTTMWCPIKVNSDTIVHTSCY